MSIVIFQLGIIRKILSAIPNPMNAAPNIISKMSAPKKLIQNTHVDV